MEPPRTRLVLEAATVNFVAVKLRLRYARESKASL